VGAEVGTSRAKRIRLNGVYLRNMFISPARAILLIGLAWDFAAGQTANQDRDVSWKKLFPNILEDQQHIWTFPVRLAQGHDLLPTAAVAGVSTALMLGVDAPVAQAVHGTSDFDGFNRIFSSNATTIGILAVPVSLYAAGYWRRDAKMTNTALLSAEALASAEVLAVVFKTATNRLRPSDVPPYTSFGDSWFEGGSRLSSSHQSFPSGHTIAAFSVATVVARRYGSHRWVPFVAYGAAAAVGFSRISLSAHFASDVFLGGVFGYSISRFTVLRQ
jgi:membrane-associated phospholipid phosphatase